MIFYPNGKEMSEIDAYTIEKIGVPQLVLMEKAALKLFDKVKELTEKNKDKILIAVEGGNNGGDGVCLGRLLKNAGYNVDVCYIDGIKKASDAFLTQINIACNCKVNFVGKEVFEKTEDLDRYTVIIDGIFGVGLTRPLKDIHEKVVRAINKSRAIKIAIDIPSGIESNTGRIMNVAVKADYTVTFGYMKLGMLYEPGREYSGVIEVADIGFVDADYNEDYCDILKNIHYSFDKEDVKEIIPKRKADSNKGTYGRTLIIAGAENMCGACIFAAKAAYKTGTGLVKVFTEKKNRIIIQQSIPEALLDTYDKAGYDETDENILMNALKWASSVVIGPGFSKSETAKKILIIVLEFCICPLVLDADALNMIAEDDDIREVFETSDNCNIIVTPHVMEMARLLSRDESISNSDSMEKKLKDIVKYIKEDETKAAKDFSRNYDVITILKDARTIVSGSDDRTYINNTGNDGMSTGGSGDVLAGMLGGFLAQNYSDIEIKKLAAMTVWLHGMAGDFAANKTGRYSLMAGDIIDSIPDAISYVIN